MLDHKNTHHIIGIARDDRFFEHKTGYSHPEGPARLTAINRMLDTVFPDTLLQVTPEPSAMEHIERVHTPGYIKKLLKSAEQKRTSLAPDTPVSNRSVMAAWLAAGACITGVNALKSGKCGAFFALVRPPGHHALPDRAGGFCMLNNLAIAARFARDGYGIERILIVDWDVHHGNGLNDVFYCENGVFYFSTHDIMLYPYSGEPSDIGSDEGEGFTLNMPVDRSFTGDDIYYLYHQTLPPLVQNFQPEMIFVAAGFDAHKDDPLGRFAWTETTYYRLTRLLDELAHNNQTPIPLLFALEGGYDPGALSRSVEQVLLALLAKDKKDGPISDTQSNEAGRLLESIFSIHQPYGLLS
ncbi:MAG: histone deacetylase [Thermodesulfobacteriota bacterium]|nr:histone deacetylase [Thermodesulfobacteriota bacterium]